MKFNKKLLIFNKNILNYDKLLNILRMDNQESYTGKGLINFLSFFFRLFYYAFWVLIAFTLFFMVFSLINLDEPSGLPTPLNLGVFFSLDDAIGETNFVNNGGTNFFISYATGNIKVTNVPYSFIVLFCFLALVLFTTTLLSIRLTIKILKTVKENAFLLIENAIRLRWIALLAIAILFTDKLIAILTSAYLSNHLEYPGITFRTANFYSITGFETIFTSLFLLVIAEVFRIGAKLKEEHDLTI